MSLSWLSCTFILLLLTVRHVSFWFQNEQPSSKLNNTPPIGAPNAAEIKKAGTTSI